MGRRHRQRIHLRNKHRVEVRKAKLKSIGLFLGFGAFIYLVWIGSEKIYNFLNTSPYFNLREIRISGCRMLDSEKIRGLLKTPLGQNLFKIDGKVLRKKVQANPLVKKAEIKKDYWNKVLGVEIEERIPLARVCIAEQEYGVDNEGFVFPLLRQEGNLFLVKGQENKILLNQKNDFFVQQKILRFLQNRNQYAWAGDLKEISLDNPEEARVLLNQGEEIFWGKFGDGSLDKKMNRLEKVFQDIKLRNKPVKYVDLRFKDMVIVKYQ